MFKVLRLKAISNCLGIRRSVVKYINISSGSYSFEKEEYPLSKIKFELSNNDKISVSFNNNTVVLSDGIEEQFSFTNKVSTLTGDSVNEYVFLGMMILPLGLDAIPYYERAINDGNWFDERAGEFEYLIGLVYENEGNNEKALEYFTKAKELGFITK